MGNWGNIISSATYQTIEGNIAGSIFTSPATGTVSYIYAYINVTTAAKNAKAAIYRNSDYALIGQSDQQSLATGASWRTFTCSTPISVTENVDYVIVAWCATGSGVGQLAYTTGYTAQGLVQTLAYDGYPATLVPGSSAARCYSIYANHSNGGYIGKCDVGASTYSNSANEKSGSKYALSENGTVWALRAYFTAAGNNFKLGVYDDDGAGAVPSTRKINCGSTAISAGWNTVSITETALTAGDYWLLYVTDAAKSLRYTTPGTGMWLDPGGPYANELTTPCQAMTSESVNQSLFGMYRISGGTTITAVLSTLINQEDY